MKVLHINARNHKGGAENFVLGFLKKYPSHVFFSKETAIENRVFKLSFSIKGRLYNFADDVLYRLFQRKLFADWSVADNIFGTLAALKKHPAYQEAQLIHLHNLHGDYFDFAAITEISNEKPVVWTLHDMWAMTGGECHVFEDVGYQKGNAQTPFANVYPLCKPYLDRRPFFLDTKLRAYQKWENVWFVPVSLWLEACLKKAFVHHPKMKIETIQNGVDTSIFLDSGKRDWEKPRILFYNSPNNPFKGSWLVTEYLHRFAGDFELWVVGEKFQSSAADIRFVAPTYNAQKQNELFNLVDILLFSSEAESFGLLPLEAMMAGVYVIASDVGGIPELLGSEKNLNSHFESGNPESLVKVVNEVLQTSLSEIREKGKRASQWAKTTFPIEKMFTHYEALYERAINQFENS